MAERRRRRATLALAASVLAMFAVGGASAAYYFHERQASLSRAGLALNEVRVLFNQANEQADRLELWGAAIAGLHGAERIVHEQGDSRLERSFLDLSRLIENGEEAARREAALRSELSATRTGKQDLGVTAADLAYAAAFRRARLDMDGATSERIAALLKERPAAIRAELAGYLDDWCKLRRDMRKPRERWLPLLKTAQAIDLDPYRERIRTTLEAVDLAPHAAALRGLAAEPKADQLPAASSTLLASALVSSGDVAAAVSLLKRSIDRNPSDLWVNFDLAVYLNESNPAQPDEAIRYFTAARALRPTSAHELGHVLEARGRGLEAVAIFRDLEPPAAGSRQQRGLSGACPQRHGTGQRSLRRIRTSDRKLSPVDSSGASRRGDAPQHGHGTARPGTH